MLALAASTAAPGNGTQNGAAAFITQLLPAIGQVFFVILLGFGLGTVKLIPVEHAEPLGKLCGVVLLPVAVFTAMLTLQGGDASWQFLGGIVVAKGGIFALVLALALAVNRGPSRLGTAAIRAVFCTQSNDFAFGLPIFTALFANHPEYDGFLYIVAPISLVVLNPIAFALMEFSRQSQLKANDNSSTENGAEDDGGAGKTKEKSILAKVVLKVARDPLVIMTFLGVILRLVFWAANYTLDDQVEKALRLVGSAFTPVALFCLGLVCVGKLRLLAPRRLPLIAGLTLVKSLLAPILCKLVFSFIFPDNPDLGNAAFIYGAFPTATGVFTYCTSYGMPHETIAVAMVVGTLLSAPIMVLFGFILASVEAPTEALNATSAAIDAAYLQEFPAMASLVACTYILIVAAVFMRRMPSTRRVLWGFIVSAGALGVVQCAAAFVLNLNCLDDGNNDTNSLGDGMITPWQQVAVVVRIWSISQHRVYIAVLGVVYCTLYDAKGNAKYATERTCLPDDTVEMNKKFVGRVQMLGHVAAAVVGAAMLVATGRISSSSDSLCSDFSTTMAWATTSAALLALVTFAVVLVWVNRRRSRASASTAAVAFLEADPVREADAERIERFSAVTDGADSISERLLEYPSSSSTDGRSLSAVVGEDYDDGFNFSEKYSSHDSMDVDTVNIDLEGVINWGVCRLNTLLLYHGLSAAMAVYVSVNTLMSDGSRRIADGGELSVSLITGFLTHLSGFVLCLIYATSADLRCNCRKVVDQTAAVSGVLATEK